ncbi:hypothetical protein B0A48_01584 [Cryoendolithus antarcticus]|uniref:DnaJ homologue subfamily C member 28 conserved domain-containing protein n=1 Tax=Cryoendolithus antarcticus TaxID=1507870 RepID=A0A1V8TPP6_9PEZI|nr:hypothetical protein B0A48_01584 [Cryoendolithus antarcticus]
MEQQPGASNELHQQHQPYGQPPPHSYAQTAQAALSTSANPQTDPALAQDATVPNGRKRKSGQPGSRGVANLTPEQLAKKRANDRDAQRAIRERTKNTIENLERRIRELENQQPYQDLQRAVQDRDRALAECESLRQRLAAVAGIVGNRDLGQTGLNGMDAPLGFVDPNLLTLDITELAALTAQQSPLPSVGPPISHGSPYPSTTTGYEQGTNPLLHPDLRTTNDGATAVQTAPMFASSDGQSRRWSPSGDQDAHYPSHGPAYEQGSTQGGQPGINNEERHDLSFVLDQGQHSQTHPGAQTNQDRESAAVLAERLMSQVTLTCPLDTLLNDFIRQQRHSLASGSPQEQIIGPDHPSFACLTDPDAARSSPNDPISSVVIDIVSKFPDIAALPERAGTLWGMYHITRWLICPCEHCYERVPEFTRPLPESLETKHALWHDYVPWPTTRRQLMRIPESRQVRFDNFFIPFCQGLSVNWPYPEGTCLVTTLGGESSPVQVKLHPDFEKHITRIENWIQFDLIIVLISFVPNASSEAAYTSDLISSAIAITKISDGALEKEQGAMSRRLEELSDQSLESGGRAARKAIADAGFSDELRARLEQKIADASFRSDNPSAFAEANMPSSAGQGTRHIAAAEPWRGAESVGDATLRMLNDAHKPLRARGGAASVPGVRGPPSRIDTGRPGRKVATGQRLANARDKTSVYASLKDETMSEEERARYRKELKDRFTSSARNVAPATIQGLTSLANQRIEDAIGRGQFKNLPRGKHIERDYNASNPFLDTTEYFMNKIIQKQEIVPPWIEKQQELVSTATRFRSQLRASWRRHVSRSIASRGGSLQSQMILAEQYAIAESIENPPKVKVEKLNAIDERGQTSQLTLAGELKPTPIADPHSAEDEIKVLEQIFDNNGALKSPSTEITVTSEAPSPNASLATSEPLPPVQPFRDPHWEQTERSYHKLAIEQLNALNRSYNLMAPQLAQKPYFNLERELRSCFADVAPQVAQTVRERALAPKLTGVNVVGHRPGGVLEKFSTSSRVSVHDERKPQYGFRQFWKDLFAG